MTRAAISSGRTIDNAPPSLPIGVRTALTITTSITVMNSFSLCSEWTEIFYGKGIIAIV
jgi:hypothetical protein